MSDSLPPAVDVEILLGALVVSVMLTLAGLLLGGGLGWCLTIPLVGLMAYLKPRWALLMPVLGLGISATLYALARQFHVSTAPLIETTLIYLFLAYSLVLALWPGNQLRRQLDATHTRMSREHGVLELMASLAQMATRTDLPMVEAAALALHRVRPGLPFTTAVLVIGEREHPRPLIPLVTGSDDSTWRLDAATTGLASFWDAHLDQTPTFFNEGAWPIQGPVERGALAVLPLHLIGHLPTSLIVRRAGPGTSWGLHDRQLLQAVAHALRLIADQQHHLRALEHSAHHDALTGCLNRHAFTQALDRRQLGSNHYTLALTDLNGFKALNDREGHARGDEALRQFAVALRCAFPADEAVYRLGGDEFAILLDDPSAGDAASEPGNRPDDVLSRVGAIPSNLRQLGLGVTGVSVGVAHASEAPDPTAVLALADRRMYLMKHQCRADGPDRWPAGRTDPSGGTSQGTSPVDQALLLLGVVLEARDVETHDHSLRVVRLAHLLGQRLGLTPAALAALKQGAYLHDLGKLVVPDRVLLKPGPLNTEEWTLMQTHADAGHRLASSLNFVDPQALTVIRSHHERWDGQGYPDRLIGSQIPELARVYAVVDVFDAMTSRRPYKEAWSVDQALDELKLQSGRQFDPLIVTEFLQLWSDQQRRVLPDVLSVDTAPLWPTQILASNN